MAQQNLQGAADAAARHPERALELGVEAQEVVAWRSAAAAMWLPYDDKLGVHAQAQGFTDHEVWDFAATPADHYPLLLHVPYFDLYRKQVVKQPDLVLAMHLRGDAFSDAQKARNFAYYEQITVRDSSLSASTQAVLAAEIGHMDLAYDYLAEVALMDLNDLEHNTRDGVHMAAVAGAWIALVEGFGGMRVHGGVLSFAPCLPAGLSRMVLNLCYRERQLRVTTTPTTATYALLAIGHPLELNHHGRPLKLTDGRARPTPDSRAPRRPPPHPTVRPRAHPPPRAQR